MKNILYNLGFTLSLVIGCQATLQENTKIQTPFAAAAFPVPETFPVDDSSQVHNTVKDFFERTLLHGNFNGGVVVAKGGTIVFEEYKGYSDLRTKDSPIGAETPMHVASVSKNFAAASILKLNQEGKVQLDQPLSDFFPNFPYQGITVRMLLSHRSGLADYMHFMDKVGWDEDRQVTNQDVLNTLVSAQPKLQFTPGTRFNYSNTNFVLLALVVEKLSGLTYPQFLQQNFFGPLQMTDTYVATTDDLQNVTPSFEGTGRYWQTNFLEATYGDKNVYTTPRDLLKWTMALNEGKVIDKTLLEQAWTPYSNEKKSVHNYGFGWRLLMLNNGKKVIYHNGRWHGTNAALAMLPDEDVTIIIIGNRYNPNIYNVARRSFDMFGPYLNGGQLPNEEETVVTVHHRHHHYSAKRSIAKRSTKKSMAKKSSVRKHYSTSSSRPVASRK